jgi:hypothetical protein
LDRSRDIFRVGGLREVDIDYVDQPDGLPLPRSKIGNLGVLTLINLLLIISDVLSTAVQAVFLLESDVAHVSKTILTDLKDVLPEGGTDLVTR